MLALFDAGENTPIKFKLNSQACEFCFAKLAVMSLYVMSSEFKNSILKTLTQNSNTFCRDKKY
jgi:hypothetical protein